MRILAVALLLIAVPAFGQQVIQSGKPLPGHAGKWITNLTLGDAGPANGGPAGTGLTELNITSGLNNGLPFCINDAPTTGPFHQLCLGANANGTGLLSYQAYGGAPPLALECNINGVVTNCFQGATGAVGQGCENILSHGGAGDDSTDNVTPFLSAAGTNPSYPCVFLPPGSFRFNSPVSLNLSNLAGGFALQGSGQGVTRLHFPNAGNGLAITETTNSQSTTFTGFRISTDQAGGGTGIILSNSSGASSGQPVGQNVFNQVTFGGAAYGVNQYWATNVAINSVSDVDFDNVLFTGDGSFHSNGIDLEGTSAKMSVQINIRGSNFWCLNKGLNYGTYVQGVTVTTSNFTCGNYGIYIPSGGTSIDGLFVNNSQFNESLFGIQDNAGMPALLVSNNIFIPGGGSVANAIGVQLNAVNANFMIHHNNFQSSGPNGIGIDIAAGSGVVQGNYFEFLNKGLVLEASSGQVKVTDDNEFAAMTTSSISNLNSANQVVGPGGWTPVLSTDGTAGTVTYVYQYGSYYDLGSVRSVKFFINATAWTGPTGNVIITGLPAPPNANAPGSCTISYASGFPIASPYNGIVGQVPATSNQIKLWIGPNATDGSMSPYPVTSVKPAIIQLGGDCQYYR